MIGKSSDTVEECDEWRRIKTRLEIAEASRLSGQESFTIEESRKQLEAQFEKT